MFRGWIQMLMNHLKSEWPEVKAYAWIHPPCDLEDEDGGLFFHLPLEADPDFGAWVHTTMYYDMENPAPVYGCDNFQHQQDFIEQAKGQRELVYYPETAWWLGFDNNLPMFLPLTGWSRAYDILEVMKDTPEVTGHLTFTTGREWGYWMFDHYLTLATWDGTTTWSQYLDLIALVFGEEGSAWMEVVKSWTDIQRKAFYEDNPLLFFYVAGELPADEAGAKVDAGARPVKPAFRDIFELEEEAFQEWLSGDYAQLEALESDLGSLLAELPPVAGEGAEQTHRIRELERGMTLTVRRVQHALALFGAVRNLRDGQLEAAQNALEEAQAITSQVIETVGIHEAGYRYPIELLGREKDSLTSYQYGYLYETSTAYFWVRRDEQLETFLDSALEDSSDAWAVEPSAVFKATSEDITLTAPNDPVASGVIGAFMPTFLFGVVKEGGGVEHSVRRGYERGRTSG